MAGRASAWRAPKLGSRPFRVVGAILLAANLVALVPAALGPSEDAGFWRLAALNLVLVLPVLACLARARLGGPRRGAAPWLAAGMAAFAAGNLLYAGALQRPGDEVLPLLASLTYVLFYPLVGAGIVVLLRRDRTWRLRAVGLDAALGAAGAATVLAASLSPVLTATQGDLVTVAFGAVYSVGDLALIAMIGAVLTMQGRRGGGVWVWLGLGIAAFCCGDVVYALQTAAGTYRPGTLWAGPWAVGLSLMALAMWRPDPRLTAPTPADATLAVPTAAMAAAVAVLCVGSQLPEAVPWPVTGLASVTLVLAGLRTRAAFRRVRQLSQAQALALTDELTGLGNRRALFELGERRVASGDRVALILIDLDDFKAVNDTLGHQAGDELLRLLAARLAGAVRRDDLLVRLGGDEFALVIGLPAGEDGAERTAAVLERITPALEVEGARLQVGASAGVAQTGAAACGVAELLRRADVAMYAAKGTAARVQTYDPELDAATRARHHLGEELDAALEEGQFVLHYQPKIDVRRGTVVGLEALVRWAHPQRGLLAPDAFLPLVESRRAMGRLTAQVLELAVRQVAEWRAAGRGIVVAVNLSASDLLDERLTDRIVGLLERYDVPGSALELEITETVLVADPARTTAALGRLRDLGLRIAVDDYGTGYSSLAYLRDLPVDALKLDRSFIAPMLEDTRTAAIVHSTIGLAHVLGMEVVAEGVEHAGVLQALAALDCDLAQGYHFSRPLPGDALGAWLPAAAVPAP